MGVQVRHSMHQHRIDWAVNRLANGVYHPKIFVKPDGIENRRYQKTEYAGGSMK